jgi:DNA-binding transcriptional MerR regulator
MKRNQIISIKQVCHLTGLPPSTLRFWEKAFSGLLEPIRTNGGQRRYDEKTLVIINEIKKMRALRMPLFEIRENLIQKQKQSLESTIESFANRLAAVVKTEIYQYLYNNQSSVK